MTATSKGIGSWPIIRHLMRKPRLLLSIGAGVAVFFLSVSFSPFQTATCSLIAWNTATILYIGMALETMLSAPHQLMKQRALLHDDGESVILLLSTLAAALSIVAIVAELATTKHATGWFQALHVGLAALTLLTSWAFIHTAFAFHYAHGYYAHMRGKGTQPCLIFPGTEAPGYTDFLYFSFVIGTSGQTADVEFASAATRGIGLLHCVISYLFNATVLALTINIAASLL